VGTKTIKGIKFVLAVRRIYAMRGISKRIFWMVKGVSSIRPERGSVKNLGDNLHAEKKRGGKKKKTKKKQ